jgi:hypothetical protein
LSNLCASGVLSALNGVNTGDNTAGSVDGIKEMVMLTPF